MPQGPHVEMSKDEQKTCVKATHRSLAETSSVNVYIALLAPQSLELLPELPLESQH